MDEPKPLDSVFKEKILRIPDYQRGYAWQKEHLKAFWEDLINLPENRNHYTGVLTLKQIEGDAFSEDSNEHWLIDDHSYEVYHIVDGQQRLTSFIILIQALIDFYLSLEENNDKPYEQIYLTDNLNLHDIIEKYLYKIKPTGNRYRTYKFGYTTDNPSYQYLRYEIFREEGKGSLQETFYTLNLRNAKTYFIEQLKELYKNEGPAGIQDIYKKLTKRFLFNEYIIKDEFDVFVAFETMNNRGKRLSDLELLKNRLIYLTTLYQESELDGAEQKSLRDSINEAWKEVYHQLGRNEKRPLNDDDFLKAHWIMYFKYSRKRGNDYIKFLLDEQFPQQKIHKKIEREVELDLAEEQRTDFEDEEYEEENGTEGSSVVFEAQLNPMEIKEYVNSLKTSSVHWFNTHFPYLAYDINDSEKKMIDRLNRAGMGYFRPLVMSIMKNVTDDKERVLIFSKIERFIFICFHLCQMRRNYRNSEFYNAARELDKNEIDLEKIKMKLDHSAKFSFNDDGTFKITDFYNYMNKRFNEGSRGGYYTWHGLKYFLYEYENSLLSDSRVQKVQWDDLLKTPKDNVSIEHIYPQMPDNEHWSKIFSNVRGKNHSFFQGSLGNLLLLSSSINSSLQNDGFDMKKNAKRDKDGTVIRNGYSDGSHSEIEVSSCYKEWTPDTIKERGLKLLSFLEKHWNLRFKNQDEKESLLFLPSSENQDM